MFGRGFTGMNVLKVTRIVGLSLAMIALLIFATTYAFPPHHHDNISERVCPICHPPMLGLQPTILTLPSLTDLSCAVVTFTSISAHAPLTLRASSRAPPAA